VRRAGRWRRHFAVAQRFRPDGTIMNPTSAARESRTARKVAAGHRSPTAAGQNACRQHGQPACQMKKRRRAAQIGRRGIGDERSSNPCVKSHMQAPEYDAEKLSGTVGPNAKTRSATSRKAMPTKRTRCGDPV